MVSKSFHIFPFLEEESNITSVKNINHSVNLVFYVILEIHEMALHFCSCKQEVGTCQITCDITPNGVFCVFMTPPLPPQLLQGFMQLLDLAPVPSQLSHASKQEISISLCPPKTDSSKVKLRSYLQNQNKNLSR